MVVKAYRSNVIVPNDIDPRVFRLDAQMSRESLRPYIQRGFYFLLATNFFSNNWEKQTFLRHVHYLLCT